MRTVEVMCLLEEASSTLYTEVTRRQRHSVKQVNWASVSVSDGTWLPLTLPAWCQVCRFFSLVLPWTCHQFQRQIYCLRPIPLKVTEETFLQSRQVSLSHSPSNLEARH